MIELLILILVLGLVVELSRRYLSDPFRSIVIVLSIVILLVWLLRFAGVWRIP